MEYDEGLPLSSLAAPYTFLETVDHQPSPPPPPPPTPPPAPREFEPLTKAYPVPPKSPPPTPEPGTSETKDQYEFSGPTANFFSRPELAKVLLASVGTGAAAFLVANKNTTLIPQQQLWIITVSLFVGSLALVVAFLSGDKFPKFTIAVVVVGTILVMAAVFVIGSAILPPGLLFMALLSLFFLVILPIAVYLLRNQGRLVVSKKPAGWKQRQFPPAEAIKLLFDDARQFEEKIKLEEINKLE
ncbi:hypothetical protein Ancab_023029 [Ancistrocladus abbreviatus]